MQAVNYSSNRQAACLWRTSVEGEEQARAELGGRVSGEPHSKLHTVSRGKVLKHPERGGWDAQGHRVTAVETH